MPVMASKRCLMLTTVRTLRTLLLTLLTSLPATTAVAQTVQGGSDADNPALLVVLVTFCVLVVGLLAHTARRMARLE
jgi:hypothetical protein